MNEPIEQTRPEDCEVGDFIPARLIDWDPVLQRKPLVICKYPKPTPETYDISGDGPPPPLEREVWHFHFYNNRHGKVWQRER